MFTFIAEHIVEILFGLIPQVLWLFVDIYINN